jgi:hypothetical protein
MRKRNKLPIKNFDFEVGAKKKKVTVKIEVCTL